MNPSFTAPPHRVVTPDDHSAWLIVVGVILLTWTVLTWCLRVMIRTRFNGPWGFDDNLVSAGTAAAVIQLSMMFRAVHFGWGKKINLIEDVDLRRLEKFIYAAQIFYVLAVSLSKISTASLISRLTRQRKHLRIAHGVTIFVSIWAVISLLLISIRCDATHPWDLTGRSCAADPFSRWIAIESVFALIEVLLFGLSIFLVWNLQMANRLKLIVVGAFICRVFVVVTIAIRLYYLRPVYFLHDPTFDAVLGAVLTQVCMHYSLIAATIPCTRPFMRAFDGYHDNAHEHETSNWSTGADGKLNLDYDLKSFATEEAAPKGGRPKITVDSLHTSGNRSSSDGPIGNASTPTSPSPRALTFGPNPFASSSSSKAVPAKFTKRAAILRPDMGEVITTVDHDPSAAPKLNYHSSKEGSLASEAASDTLIIKQTRDWEVTYERTGP